MIENYTKMKLLAVGRLPLDNNHHELGIRNNNFPTENTEDGDAGTGKNDYKDVGMIQAG
jgi:hypothetical protein